MISVILILLSLGLLALLCCVSLQRLPPRDTASKAQDTTQEVPVTPADEPETAEESPAPAPTQRSLSRRRSRRQRNRPSRIPPIPTMPPPIFRKSVRHDHRGKGLAALYHHAGGAHRRHHGPPRPGRPTRAALAERPVGGICYFAANLVDRTQTMAMLENTQSYAKTPLFLGVDEEGGRVSRAGSNEAMGVTHFEAAATYGARADMAEVYQGGSTLASELGALGFNVTLPRWPTWSPTPITPKSATALTATIPRWPPPWSAPWWMACSGAAWCRA